MPVIGLTGGIAAGKSTVGRLLEAHGAALLSADEVSRKITAPGAEVLGSIIRAFGDQYLLPDGSLNREALGAEVFSDPSARKRLEKITHPIIQQELRLSIANFQLENPERLVVVEVPLLFEAGMGEWFDAVITVAASVERQRERLRCSAGLSSDMADARITSQMDVEEKAALSQFVIRNEGSLKDLESAVVDLLPALNAVEVHRNRRE